MAVRYDFCLDKGTDTNFFIEFKSCDGSRMNLRSFLMTMQVKQGVYGKVLDELTTTNGRLIVSSSEGDFIFDQVQVTFPNKVTDTFPTGILLYDLELKSSKTITRLLEGKIKCISNVTL